MEKTGKWKKLHEWLLTHRKATLKNRDNRKHERTSTEQVHSSYHFSIFYHHSKERTTTYNFKIHRNFEELLIFFFDQERTEPSTHWHWFRIECVSLQQFFGVIHSKMSGDSLIYGLEFQVNYFRIVCKSISINSRLEQAGFHSVTKSSWEETVFSSLLQQCWKIWFHFQARTLAAHAAETEKTQFFIGTQSLKLANNQIHLVQLNEDDNSLHAKVWNFCTISEIVF